MDFLRGLGGCHSVSALPQLIYNMLRIEFLHFFKDHVLVLFLEWWINVKGSSAITTQESLV